MNDSTPIQDSAPLRRADRPPAQLRRILLLLVGLMLSTMVVSAGAFLIHLRDAALKSAADNTRGLARLLDDHLSRTLDITDATLKYTADIALRRLSGELGDEEARQRLFALRDTLPERGELLVTDAAGRVVLATSQLPPNAASVVLGDRDWFRALADGAEVMVGPLVTGRYRKVLIFSLNRRLVDRDGRFIGIVSAGIDAAFFTEFYDSLTLGRQGYIASATMNGDVVLRQPHPERYAGLSARTGTVLAAARTAPAGTLRATSPLDGIDRLASFRRLDRFGILVNAGMAIDEVLAPWRRAALLLGLALAAVTLGVLVLAGMAFRGIRREEAMTAGLEAVVSERTEEAERRAEEARRANDSKTRFLAAASHDLRQPLQAAGMFAEVLGTRLDDPAALKVVDKLRQSIEATNSLLTTLLDVSTLEAGRITPTPGTFAVLPLLRRLAEQIEPEADERGLRVRVAPCSASITTDPVLLERLLRNLAVNAVHHTVRGGILLGCRRRADGIAVQVWDTGIGIPSEMHAAVFEDFTRIDGPATTGGGRGLGLGLGVVRRMAAVLGLRLELRSAPGRGSCFTVVIPRAGPPPPSGL